MTIQITVKEVGPREERTVEVRRVTTESHKRLTASGATKILRREFLELPRLVSASKSIGAKGEFFAMHSAKPSANCRFHYIWRQYYLIEC